jgi:hypothetical protein
MVSDIVDVVQCIRDGVGLLTVREYRLLKQMTEAPDVRLHAEMTKVQSQKLSYLAALEKLSGGADLMDVVREIAEKNKETAVLVIAGERQGDDRDGPDTFGYDWQEKTRV